MISVEPARTEQRFLMHGIDWRAYQALLTAMGDRPVRITYDRGTVELMSPSDLHERLKKLMDRILLTIAEELQLPIRSQGSMTFSNEALERGLEPDECYYIQHEAAVRGRDDIDLASDPPPDLAVEIDLSSSSLKRMDIYAALGVPEVWRFDGRSLWVYELQAGGAYRTVGRSPAFPSLPLDMVTAHLSRRNDTDETTWIRSFRDVLRETFGGTRATGA